MNILYDVAVQDLLSKELAFDMNFYILTFKHGASHGYIYSKDCHRDVEI